MLTLRESAVRYPPPHTHTTTAYLPVAPVGAGHRRRRRRRLTRGPRARRRAESPAHGVIRRGGGLLCLLSAVRGQ